MPARRNRQGGRLTSTMDLTKLRPAISLRSAPGKTMDRTIAFFVAMVDPVVAKSSEEEICERMVAAARRESAGAAHPKR